MKIEHNHKQYIDIDGTLRKYSHVDDERDQRHVEDKNVTKIRAPKVVIVGKFILQMAESNVADHKCGPLKWIEVNCFKVCQVVFYFGS